MNSAPICGKCGRELKPARNGVYVIYYEKYGEKCGGNIRPYKVHNADLWECPECDFSVVCGFAHEPHTLDGEESIENYVKTLLESDEPVVKVRTWRIDKDDENYGEQGDIRV